MARRDESKTLKIIMIGWLDAEIYGKQVVPSDVAQFDEKSRGANSCANSNKTLLKDGCSLKLYLKSLESLSRPRLR